VAHDSAEPRDNSPSRALPEPVGKSKSLSPVQTSVSFRASPAACHCSPQDEASSPASSSPSEGEGVRGLGADSPGSRGRQSDAASAPSRIPELREAELRGLVAKLEWQLGSSRERQVELESQLAAASRRMQEQERELEGLRRQLAGACRASSPPQQRARPDACRRRSARAGLDQVIERAEAARRAWEEPPELPPAAPPGQQPPPGGDGGDEEFLRHLEEFQRRTDSLQRQISRMQMSSSP